MSYASKAEDWARTIAMVIIAIGILFWVGETCYQIYNPPPQQEIIFNVTGIVNATNSSIVSLQVDCMKYCIDHSDFENTCMNNCLELGKNGCD